MVQAQVRDDFGVTRAWLVVYPPDFVAPRRQPTRPAGIECADRTLTVASTVCRRLVQWFHANRSLPLVVYAEDAENHQALHMLCKSASIADRMYICPWC